MLRTFCFLILLKNLILTLGQKDAKIDIEKIFRERQVIPDVLTEPPESLLKLTYPRNVIDKPGKVMNYGQVKTRPDLSWTTQDPDSMYSLYIINPDAAQVQNSSTKKKKSEWLHWAVQNIPGNKIERGQIIVDYSAANAGQHSKGQQFLVQKLPFDKKLNSSVFL